MKKGLQYVWSVISQAGTDFAADNCFRSSAALSYYTLFSVAPIMLITITVAGFFVGDQRVQTEITEQVDELIGEQGAQGVTALLETVDTGGSSLVSLLMGIGLLVFTATTIFVQIRRGLNEIFRVQPVEGRKGWIKLILDRLVSLGLILSLGFMMIISLVLDTLIVTFIDHLSQYVEDASVYLLQAAQNLLILGLVFVVLYALFRWMSDVEMAGKYLVRGTLITTLLLLVGKSGISWYIGMSNLTELGGAASSIVILMLWVFFSSVILFFGAELIKAQAMHGSGYAASRFAKRVKVVEVAEEDIDHPANRKQEQPGRQE